MIGSYTERFTVPSLIAAFTEEKGIVDESSTRTATTETHATE